MRSRNRKLQIRLCISHISPDDAAAAHSSIEFIATLRSLFSIGLVRFFAMWSRYTYSASSFIEAPTKRIHEHQESRSELKNQSICGLANAYWMNENQSSVVLPGIYDTVVALNIGLFALFLFHKFINHCVHVDDPIHLTVFRYSFRFSLAINWFGVTRNDGKCFLSLRAPLNGATVAVYGSPINIDYLNKRIFFSRHHIDLSSEFTSTKTSIHLNWT